MIPESGRPYRHKKTGHRYWFICAAVDCTNGRNNAAVALYQDDAQGKDEIYTRDLAEFMDKFEEIKE